MAAMTREEILQAVLTLPPADRLSLTREILLVTDETEDVSEAQWEAEWGEEVDRRILASGHKPGIPAEEVFARARTRT